MLKLNNSVFPSMFVASPELLTLHGSLGQVSASESVHRPFKGTVVFPAAFCLTGMVRTSTAFYNQWRFLFPALEPWAGESWCGARALSSFSEISEIKIFLQVLNCHRQVEASSFHISTLPTSLTVTSFFISLVIGDMIS